MSLDIICGFSILFQCSKDSLYERPLDIICRVLILFQYSKDQALFDMHPDIICKVVTLLEACHMTGALTNQRRVLALAARRASAICPANDTSGATYLMTSNVSSAFWTLDF
jgi:hypothetical protein